jgi:hypothetical protein
LLFCLGWRLCLLNSVWPLPSYPYSWHVTSSDPWPLPFSLNAQPKCLSLMTPMSLFYLFSSNLHTLKVPCLLFAWIYFSFLLWIISP